MRRKRRKKEISKKKKKLSGKKSVWKQLGTKTDGQALSRSRSILKIEVFFRHFFPPFFMNTSFV
jgi:hypothetical protein